MAKKKQKQKPLLFIEVLCIALIIFLTAVFFKMQHRFTQRQFTQTYTGIFPCADCTGINMTLNLTISKIHANMGTYTLEEIYQGKNTQPLVTSGEWRITQDIHQTILQLDPQKPSQTTYYLMVNPATLQMLDKQKHTIASPLPMELYLRR